MAKYRQREGGTWTISSSLMGWGVTGIAILLVGFFLAGIYVGYGMGIEEGKQQVRSDLKQSGDGDGEVSDQIAQLIDEKQQQSDTDSDGSSAEEDAGTDSRSGAFTEEDLGFLTEGSDTESGGTEVAQTVDQGPDGTSGSGQTESTSSEQGSESLYGGQASSDETADEEETTEEETTQQTTASSTDADEPSPYGDIQTGDTDELQTFYTIQTVSFERQDYAKEEADRIRNLGHSVMINEAMVNETQYYRVRVGVFPTRSQAQEYADKMQQRGEIEDYWISQVTRE